MEVKASLQYLRMSPRKVRLVSDSIRKMSVSRAENHLRHLPKKASLPLLKLLKSAVTNAEYNFNLKKEDLFIKRITVDGGSVLKRLRPRAFGRAAQILKKTSHVGLVLDERDKRAGDAVSQPVSTKKAVHAGVSEQESRTSPERHISEKQKAKRYAEKPKLMKKSTDFARRMFQRKAI